MDDLKDLFPQFRDRAKSLANAGRRVLPWIYWPCAAFCGLLMIVAILPVGVLAIITPALLYWRTRKVGLDRVSPLIYYAPFLPLAVVAFFAGMYYLGSSHQHVTPLIIVGAVVFIVSTYGFANMLDHAHMAYKAYAEKEQPERYTAADDAFAEYRLLQFRVLVATCVLFATQSPILLVCLFALVKRSRLTAILAGIAVVAAVGAPLVTSFKSDHWVTNWFQIIFLIIAVIKADRLWFKAAFNPFWPNSARLAARISSGVGRTAWRVFVRGL